ncbi:hypothetical protein [Streptomyces sp. NPDC002676]
MSKNSAACPHLNARRLWCRAAVVPGTDACQHHQDGQVRDWTADGFRAADAAGADQR